MLFHIMMTVTCMFTGSSSYVVQIKRFVGDRVFAVIPAATGRGTYLTRDTTMLAHSEANQNAPANTANRRSVWRRTALET